MCAEELPGNLSSQVTQRTFVPLPSYPLHELCKLVGAFNQLAMDLFARPNADSRRGVRAAVWAQRGTTFKDGRGFGPGHFPRLRDTLGGREKALCKVIADRLSAIHRGCKPE
jgi:hypothetical protein